MSNGPIANLLGKVNSSNELVVSATISSSGGAISDGVDANLKATVLDLAHGNPLTVAIVDANGDQVAGSAVSESDGANVALGTTTDAANAGAGTVMAKLRYLTTLFADVYDAASHYLKVQIQNATLAVTQSGTWTVQPGNTANTTAWKMDGSAVTQPVSAAALPLPTGASTAAKQPALGTAGTASADVISVQGIASMTPLLVTPAANSAVNVAQINGATPLMGAGNTGTGSPRVTIATDQAALPITTIIPGAAATNLGKAEDAAHSSGDVGVFALAVSNENSTAFGAASGDYAPHGVNRYGHSYVTAPPPSHASSNGTPITATTTTVIAAPSAGNHTRITRFLLSNGGATACWTALRDGAAGTRHYNSYLLQGSMVGGNLMSTGPLDLTTATRLDIFMSAAGSVEYQIDYVTVAD